MITGRFAVAASAFSARSTSHPCAPGRTMSSVMATGLIVRASRSASSALRARIGTYAAACRYVASVEYARVFVLDDQHALAGRDHRSVDIDDRAGNRRSREMDRQRERERAPFPDLAGHGERAALQLDEFAHQRQAEARAAVLAVERAVDLAELLEDQRQILRRRCRCRGR